MLRNLLVFWWLVITQSKILRRQTFLRPGHDQLRPPPPPSPTPSPPPSPLSKKKEEEKETKKEKKN